jgi:mRNA interferase MazF
MNALPSRGEIWRVDFDPVTGHEQGAARPALIVSADVLNHGPSELVTVVPVTTKTRPLRSYLRIMPPEGGLTQTSFIICDQVRTISIRRLGKLYGSVSPETLAQVAVRLRFLLDIE